MYHFISVCYTQYAYLSAQYIPEAKCPDTPQSASAMIS